MDKKKIDMKKYTDMHHEATIVGNDTTAIVVRDHIPYALKEEMAREMAGQIAMIHDDSCVYIGFTENKVRLYMIAKYYTDIDVDDMESDVVADFLINNGLIKDIIEFICDDLDVVEEMYIQMCDAMSITYKDDRSITKALRTSFGFLFNGEDITESLAKAEAMKDTMINAVAALRTVEEEHKENISNGTMSVGGAILNFAKKQE